MKLRAKDAASIRAGIDDAKYALLTGGEPIIRNIHTNSYLYAKAYLRTIYAASV